MILPETWWTPLSKVYGLVGQVHTFAVGPGMARIHQPGVWSVGEVVFGADQRIWYVRSQATSPPLGALLRERFPDRAGGIEAAASTASGEGVRLGAALVGRGLFEEQEIVRMLRVQAAVGLIDIAERCDVDELDVAWTPLSDGEQRLPSPGLLETYLAAAHRVTMGSTIGERVEDMMGLRRVRLGGMVLVRTGEDRTFLPVRRFGPLTVKMPNLFRLSDFVTTHAADGDQTQEVVFPGDDEPLFLVVRGPVAAVVRPSKPEAAGRVLERAAAALEA